MAKVNIHGVDVNIITDEEGEKADALACMRVFDLPIPPVLSQIDHCTECGERVWVSNRSPRKPRRICVQCIEHLDKTNKPEGGDA